MKRKSEDGNKPAFVKRKTELVFDPNKRQEFLSGFHKRKVHRKKLAQGDLQRKLKEEVRRIRHEAKGNVKKLYHSYKPIPELSAADREEDEYDTENVTVKVIELSTTDLAKENNWIGENRAAVRDEEDDEDDPEEDETSDEEDIDTIPGMELDGEKRNKKNKESSNENEEEHEEEMQVPSNSSGKQKPRGPILNLEGVSSKKELNRKLKRHAQKSMQKSKAYQRTVRVQQQKQLKNSRRVRHFKTKHLKRKGKLQDGVKQSKGKKRRERD
ncbi:nucleolar protein 12 [Armigeres subalbatus]|uniref:nucleolar protein 12 n=1 Tax=Armigeres subalbatus TaxID=124917 RepID=UPI002ED04764